MCGGIPPSRCRSSAGARLGSARLGAHPTRIRAYDAHGAAHASQSLLHRASRCRPLGALVGALSSRCDAAALAAGWAGWFRPRRYLFASCSPCAAAALLCSSTSGRKVSAGACAGGSRQTPGRRAGDAAREAAAGRAAGRAAGDFPPRLALEACSGSRSSAVATPRVAPGPAHAGSQVAPAHGAAFRAAPAVRTPRLCLEKGRLKAALAPRKAAEKPGYSGDFFSSASVVKS